MLGKKFLPKLSHPYRIYSNNCRGADLIFRVSDAVLIRGRRLFKRLIPQRQNILIVQFNLLHEYFFHGFFHARTEERKDFEERTE